MKFPDFQSDFLITVENPVPKIYVDELLIKKIPDTELKIEVREIGSEKSYTSGTWIISSSFINLYIGESLLENHYKSDLDSLEDFLDKFKEMIKPITEMSVAIKTTDEIKSTRPFAFFSVFYHTKDNYIFHYLFEFEGDEDAYIVALKEVFKSLLLYNSEGGNDFKKAVKESYVQS
ncbi:MAG: hypothetical protein LPK21_12675, partial [Hymenobacteraceae bacterium]|nr:hypothetical protein [Hymenobacteraceae bacterium]